MSLYISSKLNPFKCFNEKLEFASGNLCLLISGCTLEMSTHNLSNDTTQIIKIFNEDLFNFLTSTINEKVCSHVLVIKYLKIIFLKQVFIQCNNCNYFTDLNWSLLTKVRLELLVPKQMGVGSNQFFFHTRYCKMMQL